MIKLPNKNYSYKYITAMVLIFIIFLTILLLTLRLAFIIVFKPTLLLILRLVNNIFISFPEYIFIFFIAHKFKLINLCRKLKKTALQKTIKHKEKAEERLKYIISLFIILLPFSSIILTIYFSLEEYYSQGLNSLKKEELHNIIKRIIDTISATLILIGAARERYNYIQHYSLFLIKKIKKVIGRAIEKTLECIIEFLIIIFLTLLILYSKIATWPHSIEYTSNQLINILTNLYKTQPQLIFLSIFILSLPLITLLMINFIISMKYTLIVLIVSALYLFKYIGFLGF